MSHNLQPNDSCFIDSGSFALFFSNLFTSLTVPSPIVVPPPFNPTAKFNWNHSLWFFCEDPFHGYRDTAQSGKEICIDQNGFKVIHNPIKKHKPVFHEGIVKTLMYFYNHCLLYRVFSTAGAGQSCQQLAAWWIQNSVSLSLYFSTFLHPASLLTISPSILPFHFYCVVGFVWFFCGFFSPGVVFFFSFFLAAKLNCYSVGMSIKIHLNLNGISVRHDFWVRISRLQLSHMEAENRMKKL